MIGLIFRLALLLGVVVLATLAAGEIREALSINIRPNNEVQIHRMLMSGLVAYVGLLALPFVPGAEIGFAILTAFGAAIAPLVYGATVVAMMLAYAIGRLLPVKALARGLSALRLQRAADLMLRAAPLSREERLTMLLQGAPPKTLKLVLRHRYVGLALLVNLPGNSLIGGGGGIMMMAGLSGLFAPLPTFIAVAVAVSPVPIAVFLMGV